MNHVLVMVGHLVGVWARNTTKVIFTMKYGSFEAYTGSPFNACCK